MIKVTLIPFINLIELSYTQLIHVLKDHGKLNKKGGPSVDISNPLGRGNKIIMRGRAGRNLGRRWKGEGKRGKGLGMGGDRREAQQTSRRMS